MEDYKKYWDSVMKRFAYKVSRKKAKLEEKASEEQNGYFDISQKEVQER